MAHQYKHTTVTRVVAGSPGVKAVYVVRHRGVVVGRFLSSVAAHRKAREAENQTVSLDLRVQQPFAIGLFRDIKP